MRPSHLLCAFASIAVIAAAPANEAPASIPLRRSASIQSTVTSSSNPQPSDSGAILYPAIYNTNVANIHNLDPQLALQVYYEEPGNGSNAAIVAFEDLKHPTVVLEHSSYITNVTCSKGKVALQFLNRSIALYAFNSWNANISSGIIFVTNHPTCSDGYPAERGWILISTVAKNGASIACDYVDVLVQDIIKTVGVYFGQNSVPVNNAASAAPNSSSQSSTESSQRSATSAFLSKTSTTSYTSTSTQPSSSTSKRTSTTSRTTASTPKSTVASQLTSQSPTSSSSRTLTTHGSSSSLQSISVTSSTSESLKTSQTSKSSGTSSNTSTLRSTSSVSVHPSTLSSSFGSKPSSSSNTKITNASHSSSYTSTSSIGAVIKSLSFSHTSSSIGSSVSKQPSTSSTAKLSSTIASSLDHSRTSTSGSSSVFKPSSSSPSEFSSFTTKHSTIQSSSATRLSSSTFPRSSTSNSRSISKPSLSSISSISSSLSTAHSTTRSTSQSPFTQLSSSSISRSSTSSSSSASKSSSSSEFLKSSSFSTTSHPSTQFSVTRMSSSSFSVSSTSSASTTATSQPFVTIADFDIALDDVLDYMNSSAPGFWFQLLPGTLLPQMSGFGTPPSLSTGHLERRDWDLVSIASALTENLSKDITLAVSNVQTTFATASTTIDAAVSAAIGVVIESLNALSPFTLGPFPFSATPKNNATTDFGAGIQLTSTSGTYKGACRWEILVDAEEGITEAVFDLTGSIHAQIEIAVIATVTASASDQKNLITQGLPDLTVPGFLVLGPAIVLDIGATVSVEALGGLAAGYQLNWPAITAHFDILNDVYSASGLMPVGTPIADTELNITSTASLYGLVTLSFGIDVMGGKYKANVGLVDKPEIDAFTEVIVYTDPQIAAMDDGTVICVGENFTLGITDSAYADVVWGGVGTKPISTKTYPLTTWAGPTFTTCFGSLSTIHHSSTVSSTTSPTPTPTGPGGGDCDPVILADGYCCVLPDNWVDNPENPQVDAYSECSAAAIVSWKAAVIAECGSSKACYDTYWDPLGLVTLDCGNDTGNDSQTYAFRLCNMDYWYQSDKWVTLKFLGEYGKRSIKERKAGSVDVVSRIRGLQDRQGRFVNIVGHGTRNATTMLAWTEDGNLVASQNGTLFATLNGNVIGDINGRFLHYYELWMGESEISRLRLASLDMMPVGSVLVSLAPMDVGLASPSLVAFTSSGAYYYIITCTITGQPPKLFLTRDVSLGIELLMEPGLENTLTGGVVEQCGLLPWSI